LKEIVGRAAFAGVVAARCRALVHRRLTVWILLALVVGLAPLAYSSPIDPSFPGGFYDNGDFDDVIIHLTSGVSVVEAAPLYIVSPVENVAGTVNQVDPWRAPSAALGAAPSRAPPVA
jgi:hypothetical protein